MVEGPERPHGVAGNLDVVEGVDAVPRDLDGVSASNEVTSFVDITFGIIISSIHLFPHDHYRYHQLGLRIQIC